MHNPYSSRTSTNNMELFDPYGNVSVLRPEARYFVAKVLYTQTKSQTNSSYRISEPEIHLLGWNVPQSDLHTIPEHWLTQQEPQASMHYLLGLLYVAFALIALTGNGLVIWVFSS